MGLDILVLVTEWEPAVAAYRENGLDFFWSANVARNKRFAAGDQREDLPELPFLDEWDMPGGRSSYLYSCDSWDHLRPHVPAELRARLDTVFGAVMPGDHVDYVDWIPEDRDDLSVDAGITHNDGGGLYYAMRPATAKAITAIDVPWDELYRLDELHPVPEDHPDHGYLHADAVTFVAGMHLGAVAEAAASGRGVIGLITH